MIRMVLYNLLDHVFYEEKATTSELSLTTVDLSKLRNTSQKWLPFLAGAVLAPKLLLSFGK